MFDEIPKNREESYPCPICDKGEITKDSDKWFCNTCDFSASTPRKSAIATEFNNLRKSNPLWFNLGRG